MIKGILMDMGETIVHNKNISFKNGLEYLYSININKEVDKEIFINYGMNIVEEVFKSRKFIEIKAKDFIKLLKETFNLNFRKRLTEVEVEFSLKISDFTYIKNIEKLLKYFKSKNYPVIVLSNTSFSKKAITAMLGELNPYFKEVIVSSDYVVRKPYKAFFDLGINKLGMDKSDIYYIGNDFYNDIYGASNAGIYPIWFNDCHKERYEDLKVEEYMEIDDYDKLIEMDF